MKSMCSRVATSPSERFNACLIDIKFLSKLPAQMMWVLGRDATLEPRWPHAQIHSYTHTCDAACVRLRQGGVSEARKEREGERDHA